MQQGLLDDRAAEQVEGAPGLVPLRAESVARLTGEAEVGVAQGPTREGGLELRRGLFCRGRGVQHGLPHAHAAAQVCRQLADR